MLGWTGHIKPEGLIVSAGPPRPLEILAREKGGTLARPRVRPRVWGVGMSWVPQWVPCRFGPS